MKYRKKICFYTPKKMIFEMKYFFIVYMVFVCAFTVKGQRIEDRQGGERIRAMKVGMITQELKLNENQAEKFWPIYNSFSEAEDPQNICFDLVKQYLKNKKIINPIDLAMGTGRYLFQIKNKLDYHGTLFGVDYSKDMCDFVEKRIKVVSSCKM